MAMTMRVITGLDLRTLVDSVDNFNHDLLDSVFFQNVNNLGDQTIQLGCVIDHDAGVVSSWHR